MNPPQDQVGGAMFTLEREDRGPTIVIKMAGAAAAETASQISRVLQEAAQAQPKLLAIELSELGFISSTGLGSLVDAHVTCQKNSKRMLLIAPKPLILEVLSVTKLDTLFDFADSVEDAEQIAGM
jgi:anti-sigma B factor antagonist